MKTVYLLILLITVFVWHFTLRRLFERFSPESRQTYAPVMRFIQFMLIATAVIVVGSTLWRSLGRG